MKFNATQDEKNSRRILSKNVQKTPEEVRTLADNIKDVVERLTNTDYIIEATKNDLAKVNRLKQDAKYAKSNATILLKEAEGVNESLNKTKNAQLDAEVTINKAWKDYLAVENILNQVSSHNDFLLPASHRRTVGASYRNGYSKFKFPSETLVQ